MRRGRVFSTLLVAIGCLLWAGTAAAQGGGEEPWEPKVFPRAELIDFGTFPENPLDLPFQVLETEEVPTYDRIDYHLHLGASFDEVVGHFEESREKDEPAASFRDEFVPAAGDEPLTINGHATVPEGRRFTLGHPKMRRHFVVEIREKADGRALLIFENAVTTQRFLGLVPGRTPFRPVGAEPISLD